jgi:hypothetical protein
MHVTIETSHRADPTSKIEMLRLGQPSIIITVSVDPEKEPNASLIVIAEKLVNLDKVKLVQAVNRSGIMNNQTIYLNSFEDSKNMQWVECTAARNAKKQGEPLFLVKNPTMYTNTSVYYDNITGRSYLRIDMSQTIYKRSIEVAKIQFNTCQRDQMLGKHPIYRFVFYQYQNNTLLRKPKEPIPPFVFGTINHGQNVKAIEGYKNMLARINNPELQEILREPEDNAGASGDVLQTQDAMILAARSLASHVSSSSGSAEIAKPHKLSQKERIRQALNSISLTEYKPLPIPETLPPRLFPNSEAVPLNKNSEPTPCTSLNLGPPDAIGMIPVPEAVVGVIKKREKPNNTPVYPGNKSEASVLPPMIPTYSSPLQMKKQPVSLPTPPTNVMSILQPNVVKPFFTPSQPYAMMNQVRPSMPLQPYYAIPNKSPFQGMKYHTIPSPSPKTGNNIIRPMANRTSALPNISPRPPIAPVQSPKAEPPISINAKRTAFIPTAIAPITIIDEDEEDDAVQPPSPSNIPVATSLTTDVSTATPEPPKAFPNDEYDEPIMPPDDDDDLICESAPMDEEESALTLTRLIGSARVIEESDDEDKTSSEEDAEINYDIDAFRMSTSDDEEGDESPEPVDPNDGEYKERRRSSVLQKESRGRSKGEYNKGGGFKCTVCDKKKIEKQGNIKRQVTRSNVYLYQLVFGRSISCGRVCQECLDEYNRAPCKICGGTDFRAGTLSLKSDLIPKYEQAFGRQNLQEGKLCRGCYGKFYAFTNRGVGSANKRHFDQLGPLTPPVKRNKNSLI